jgi:hypothetical protein
VNFTPLLGEQRFVLAVSSIPEKYRRDFVFNDGRSRTMKEINGELALVLLKAIIENI